MKLKDLLNQREKWTQGAFARDVNGYAIEDFGGITGIVNDDRCVCWCLSGAIWRLYYSKYNEIIKLIEKEIGFKRVSVWNDEVERTFEDIQKITQILADKHGY